MAKLETASTKEKQPFPLHLTPFENYMRTDACPRYPMTFIVILELTGNLDRQAFLDAIDDALSRHPLLRAVIQPAKQQRDCWVSSGNVKPNIDWGGPHDPIQFEDGEYIDLRREVGLRFWIRHDQHQAVVTTQFHHAVCDGIGSYHFLGDVLYAYAQRTGTEPLAAQTPLDPKRLRERVHASYDPNRFRGKSGKIDSAWPDATKLALQRNAVLHPTRKIGLRKNHTYPFPGIRSHVFDKPAFRTLRLAAQDLGQNINDLLLEKLFLALRQWNSKHRQLFSSNTLCVMIPLSLRETKDNDIPACNIVAQAFIRRGRRLLNDPEGLRQSLREEIVRLKRDRHQVRFMHLLSDAHHFHPRLLRATLFFNRCLATAILSNTGDPTRQFLTELPRQRGAVRCGNLLLEDFYGVPPIRPGTRATISIFTYRRVLKISLRCDPNHFSEDDTQELLDTFVDNILKSARS